MLQRWRQSSGSIDEQCCPEEGGFTAAGSGMEFTGSVWRSVARSVTRETTRVSGMRQYGDAPRCVRRQRRNVNGPC